MSRVRLAATATDMAQQEYGYENMQGESDGMNWDDPIWWLHCECHNLAFRKRADLARHLNKESRRFKCEVPDCPSTTADAQPPCFGTLNDKKRHYRDVHSMTVEGEPLERFYCPWVACRRHTEGFPRRQNLDNHIKSLHAGQEPDTLTANDAASLGAALRDQAGPTVQPFPTTVAPNDLFAGPIPPSNLGPASTEDSNISDSQMAPVPALTAATSIESFALTVDEESDEMLRYIRDDYSNSQQRSAKLKGTLTALEAEVHELRCDLEQIEARETQLKSQLDARRDTIRRRRAARGIGTRRGGVDRLGRSGVPSGTQR